MALRDHVRIARRFQRAIRIDSDLRNPQALEGFICPRSSAEILLTMGRHIAETGQAAFTWTGPYGSGKSSLVVALSALLSGETKNRNSAAQIIGRQTANQLWKLLPPLSKGWRVLPVVGRRESPTLVIGEALVAAGLAPKPSRNGWSESRVLEVLTGLAAENRSTRGGLIIFIDEMGKFLEGAAGENADIYIFQQLAELAARSDHRLIVVGILHQAFEEYAHRLAREQRDEWAKIQGRFIDLVVNTAGEEQLEILARAIESDHHPKKPSSAVKAVAECISANHRGDKSGLAHTLERCWPLHPLVAALLGPVSRRRFGQNQRSLFGFLNSSEPYGFQDFLRDAGDAALYTPDKLWDYLRINLEPSILASPDGHRWSLAVEAIERCEGLGGDELHLQLLKALALIDLFKERSGLLATAEILGECAHGYGPKQITKAL
ncbi:MAG: ATP-binding protein, partial [Gammaproteobacteria bacterium]|nr:ATP-binding protein [Gammaproteobacteria bacterium]